MSQKKPVIFCDFDGTLTEKDVGHWLYRTFAGDQVLEHVNKWKKGQISSRECLLAEAALVRVNEKQLYAFLDSYPLREGAQEFYHKTVEQNIPFYIASDGADLYIEYILNRFGLNEIKIFANHAYLDGDRFIMEFPYTNDGCERCGSCKGSRIREMVGSKRDRFNVIYIGDGLSDICAVPEADITFARADLLEYCLENNFQSFEYVTFYDILKRLRKLKIIF